MTEAEQKMIETVQRAAQFLCDKGHRDAGSFTGPQVVDLLCEFAAEEISLIANSRARALDVLGRVGRTVQAELSTVSDILNETQD